MMTTPIDDRGTGGSATTSIAFALLGFLLGLAFVAFVGFLWFRGLGPDMYQADFREARHIVQHGERVIANIEAERMKTGSYPLSIDAFAGTGAVPGYGAGDIRWFYCVDESGAFELGASIGRWVSTYDFVVRRSDGAVESAWRDGALGVGEVDGWTYILGAELVPFIACRDTPTE